MEVVVQELATVFAALGNEVRLKIVEMLLKNRGMFCSEIVNELHLSQPTISHHLKELRRANIIVYKKEGTLIYYEVNKDYLSDVLGRFLKMLNS